jgi:enoyl-CoA hydratase/carnithine racemase
MRAEKTGGIATVTLNRPDALNALGLAMREELAKTFSAVRDDPEVHVLVLTSSGRAFVEKRHAHFTANNRRAE